MTYFKNMFAEWRALYEARHEPESLRPLAESFWRILLSLAVLCICGILVYGVTQFVGVLDQLSSGTSASAHPPVVLDRKQLEATLGAFDTRAAYPGGLQTHPVIVDPSK